LQLKEGPLEDHYAPKFRDPNRNAPSHGGLMMRVDEDGEIIYDDDAGAACNAVSLFCVLGAILVNALIR